jgi:hypothetical protein
MPRYLVLDGIHGSRDYHVRRLTPEQLSQHGYRITVREDGDAPLGYEPAIAQEQDGTPVWYIARSGTQEERDAETLSRWRNSTAVSRLACRCTLLSHSEYAGEYDSEWDRVEAYIAEYATPLQRAYFEDAQRWNRMDATLVALGSMLGYTDTVLDDRLTEAQTLEEEM